MSRSDIPFALRSARSAAPAVVRPSRTRESAEASPPPPLGSGRPTRPAPPSRPPLRYDLFGPSSSLLFVLVLANQTYRRSPWPFLFCRTFWTLPIWWSGDAHSRTRPLAHARGDTLSS